MLLFFLEGERGVEKAISSDTSKAVGLQSCFVSLLPILMLKLNLLSFLCRLAKCMRHRKYAQMNAMFLDFPTGSEKRWLRHIRPLGNIKCASLPSAGKMQIER